MKYTQNRKEQTSSNDEVKATLQHLEILSFCLTPGSASKYIENISYLKSIFRLDEITEKYINSQIISIVLKEILSDAGVSVENFASHQKALQNFQKHLNKLILNNSKLKSTGSNIESSMKVLIEANHRLVKENIQIVSEEGKKKLFLLGKINDLSKDTPLDWNLTAFQNLIDKSLESQSFPLYTKQVYPFLPEVSSKSKTLVLDLDETLVHKSGQSILIRPGAESFLQSMSEDYEIVIFTAAIPIYADFALRKIDPENKVKLRLYRQNISFDQEGPYKDLEKLGRDLRRTVLVDNLESNFRYQQNNGICIKTWTGEAEDNELFLLKSKLKAYFEE
jgi:hypothetical protein